MLVAYFQGIILGMAMILPIGPQNAFVLSQGIRRQYPVMVAALCAISDAILISLGVFGSVTAVAATGNLGWRRLSNLVRMGGFSRGIETQF